MNSSEERLNQWISVLEGSCDIDNTNCYETVDSIMKNRTVKKKITGMEEFVKQFKSMLIRNSIHADCNIYRIDINISDKIYSKVTKRDRKTNVFNHSFMVVQCQDRMTLFDAWEAIHFRKARKIVKWGDFDATNIG